MYRPASSAVGTASMLIVWVSSGPVGPGKVSAVVPAVVPELLLPALEQPATASATVTPADAARSHLPVLPVMETPYVNGRYVATAASRHGACLPGRGITA